MVYLGAHKERERKIRFATWNIRTLHAGYSWNIVAREVQSVKLDTIVQVQEAAH
jgi:hypothetical protein